jgi:hypothetical protein
MSHSWEAASFAATQKVLIYFKPEILLPYSQDPSTVPNPSQQSCPYHHILSLQDHSYICGL